MKTINIIFLLLFPLFVFGQIDSNKREIDYTSSGSVNKTQKGTSYLLTNFIGGTFKKILQLLVLVPVSFMVNRT